MEAEKRKLIKFSNYSLCVTLPKWVIKSFNWKKGDLINMEVDSESGKIIITGSKKKPNPAKQIKKEKKNSGKLRW